MSCTADCEEGTRSIIQKAAAIEARCGGSQPKQDSGNDGESEHRDSGKEEFVRMTAESGTQALEKIWLEP